MHKQCYLDYVRCLGEIEGTEDNADDAEATNDFAILKDFIEEAIIEGNKAVSMKAIHSLYKTGYGHAHEKVYRNRLKTKIINEFGNQLKFLRIDGQTPEIIVSTEGLDSTTVIKDKGAILKMAAEYLRHDGCNLWNPELRNLKSGITELWNYGTAELHHWYKLQTTNSWYLIK